MPQPVASNEVLCLPPGYRQQPGNNTHDDYRTDGTYWCKVRVGLNAKWQHHVYLWAARLVRSRGLRRVLDVGCGPCVKLSRHLAPLGVEITGIDQPAGLNAARARGVAFQLVVDDLEQPASSFASPFDLIICADVIEHLADPEPMLGLIRRASHAGTIVIFSTPERARERGRDCTASNKPEHVREWTREEFARYLASRGFQPRAHHLFPKDDADPAPLREAERDYRLRRAERSPLCCQAWACSVEGAGFNADRVAGALSIPSAA